MNDALNEIERLLPLLEMAFQVEQVKMAKIAARISGLKQQLAELDRPKETETFSVATRAGADIRWATWAEERKTLINQEMALAAQERERARSGVASALSKLEAARQVHARALLEAQRTAARRIIN